MQNANLDTTHTNDLASAEDWVSTFERGQRTSFVTVLGPSRTRSHYYGSFDKKCGPTRVALLGAESPIDTFFRVVQGAVFWSTPPSSWSLLWALGRSPDLLIEEPLRSKVDKPGLFHDLFRVIWEVRFAAQEAVNVPRPLLAEARKWLATGAVSPESSLAILGVKARTFSREDRVDVLLFLLTLAAQNQLGSTFFVALDGVEQLDRPQQEDLLFLLTRADTWTKAPGCPLGFLVGWDGNGGALIPRLAHLLMQGIT